MSAPANRRKQAQAALDRERARARRCEEEVRCANEAALAICGDAPEANFRAAARKMAEAGDLAVLAQMREAAAEDAVVAAESSTE